MAITLAVVGSTLSILALVFALSMESKKIISSLPENNMEKVIDESSKAIERSVNTKETNFRKMIDSSIEKSKNFLISIIPDIIKKVSNTVVFFFTCPIYVFFMLLYRQNLRGFYYESLRNEDKKRGNQILLEVEDSFGNYLKGMLIVISIITTLTVFGLWALGLKYAIFLGVLAGLLSLIPFIGIIVSALIPITLALLTKDSLWYAVGVVAVFAVVQFLEGNFITPKIVGNKVDVNPLAVILGIVIFGAIGGIPAMIITVPFLGLMKIIASHKPNWKPIEKLLQA
jgi:predicted PurR-regulated permease PerM